MSRPRHNDPRRYQVSVRYSAAEFVRVTEHAQLAGKSVTAFARSVMLRRPRTRRAAPTLISLTPRLLSRWRHFGLEINRLARDLNTLHQLDLHVLSVAVRSLRSLLHRCFPDHFHGDRRVAPYQLAPPVRYALRCICTNLVQIADRLRAYEQGVPLPLAHLIYRFRAILNGDATHGP